MAILVRLSEEDTALFKSYATLKNISLSDLIKSAVYEKIEDEFDLKYYEEAIKEFNQNPTTYTLDEVEQELGLI